MLALNLLPGTGLGCFSLGCSINQALITVRQAQTMFGCVELKYFEKTTSVDDILLNFPEHGVHLMFESSSQKLRLIEVYDLSRLQVKRGAATVGGSAHPPTFEALYDLMGPTYPGQVDTAHGCYVMHWPGLLVLFPIASQHAASWQDMQQGGALPLALPGGTAPVASRLCIHAGNAAVSLGELAKAIPPAYFETPASLGIRIGKGLTMDKTHQQLSLGDSPQDAWSTLGAPNATFSKQTPRAGQGRAQQQVSASPADYFYNYFDRGLDVLFCGTTHRIKKESDLPVQDWMRQAEGAHKSASNADYSPAAPAAVQQALLDDIKAMTRADSDAGSSDSSLTQQGAPFSAPTEPQTGKVTPPSYPPDAQETDYASLGAEDKVTQQQQRQHMTGADPSVSRQDHSAEVERHQEEEEQRGQQLPEEEARAELAGGGESAHAGCGDYSESAGDVGLEGWDDEDPMAMLSQSVQSLAQVQQAEPEPVLDVVVRPGSSAASTPHAIIPSHITSEKLSAKSVGAAETGQAALSSNNSQDARSWAAREVPNGIMPEHTGAASDTVLMSTGGGPYGPTMVHGYPGIVFEVTQAGQIASVTLFDI
ncbi:hypothetical protein WJX82_003400 [Trebouxia sp. C0006]